MARAKKKMQTALLGHLDGTAATAEDIGRQVLALGRRMSAAEVWQRIEVGSGSLFIILLYIWILLPFIIRILLLLLLLLVQACILNVLFP